MAPRTWWPGIEPVIGFLKRFHQPLEGPELKVHGPLTEDRSYRIPRARISPAGWGAVRTGCRESQGNKVRFLDTEVDGVASIHAAA